MDKNAKMPTFLGKCPLFKQNVGREFYLFSPKNAQKKQQKKRASLCRLSYKIS